MVVICVIVVFGVDDRATNIVNVLNCFLSFCFVVVVSECVLHFDDSFFLEIYICAFFCCFATGVV